MRWITRAALAALSSVVSVFIACAYGTPWRYVKAGRVTGVGTSTGIPGIRVACAVGDDLPDVTTTDAEGGFSLQVTDTCDELRFTDVDGSDNGEWQETTLPFVAADEAGLLVELEPAP